MVMEPVFSYIYIERKSCSQTKFLVIKPYPCIYVKVYQGCSKFGLVRSTTNRVKLSLAKLHMLIKLGWSSFRPEDSVRSTVVCRWRLNILRLFKQIIRHVDSKFKMKLIIITVQYLHGFQ